MVVFRGFPEINNVTIGAVRALCENAPLACTFHCVQHPPGKKSTHPEELSRATNQRPIGNTNHHSRSMLVPVPQSGDLYQIWPSVVKNWCRIFSLLRSKIRTFLTSPSPATVMATVTYAGEGGGGPRPKKTVRVRKIDLHCQAPGGGAQAAIPPTPFSVTACGPTERGAVPNVDRKGWVMVCFSRGARPCCQANRMSTTCLPLPRCGGDVGAVSAVARVYWNG